VNFSCLLRRPLLEGLRGYHQDAVQIAGGDRGGRSNGSDGIVAKGTTSLTSLQTRASPRASIPTLVAALTR
jgi:hypothetical protein